MSSEGRTDRGLYGKYDVRKDGESVEDCFVLEPEDDRAARVALKAYAAATNNEDLEKDLRGQFDLERSDREVWEANNESFSYEPPEKPGDAWSQEEYQELHDRFISRRTEWFCDKCTGKGPMSSLQKARSHVSKQHSPDLVKKYETPRDELEAETDGGTSESKVAKHSEENHDIADFSGGESQ